MDEFDAFLELENEVRRQAVSEADVHYDQKFGAHKGEQDGLRLGSELGYYFGFLEQLTDDCELISGQNSTKQEYSHQKDHFLAEHSNFEIAVGN